EHLCLPGLSSSGAKVFRDKLSMAVHSQSAGINVPEFVPLVNIEEVDEFMKRVPGPWVIKPRSDVSAIGIRKVVEPEDVWRAIDAEFIKGEADGKFYFLEIAARVGGAYIAEVLEAATGVNLWREWAKLEIMEGKAPGRITPLRKEYAGIILSLAKQEDPDTSA